MENSVATGTSHEQDALSSKFEALMEKSPLTLCIVSDLETVKAEQHQAVFAGGKPVVLTGPLNNKNALASAKMLAESAEFALIAKKVGLPGEIQVGYISEEEVSWPQECVCIASKPEDGKSTVHALLPCKEAAALASYMAISDSCVKAFVDFDGSLDGLEDILSIKNAVIE